MRGPASGEAHMDNEHRPDRSKTILRLTEVLRRTGFSRSTLYLRIAKGEFPPQVSLGARSVGWVEAEVDAWIARKVNMRPAADSMAWLPAEELRAEMRIDRPTLTVPPDRKPTRPGFATSTTNSRGNDAVPDLAQLELIGTRVYVDKKTGTLWFQVLRPGLSSS